MVHSRGMKAYYADINTEVISRLRALRKANGLSQSDLASLLGETQAYVSRVERQERRLDVAEFLLWCKVLSIDPTAVEDDGSHRVVKVGRDVSWFHD